ncbi:MAG: hypothetical protein E6Q97_26860 [Desulfurellales bacterium]|nr:MAG: hypothetical protein E6Q97_26860 [Desulfurellales bacterium]
MSDPVVLRPVRTLEDVEFNDRSLAAALAEIPTAPPQAAAVDNLTLAAAASYQQAQLQQLANRLDELLNALRAAGYLA